MLALPDDVNTDIYIVDQFSKSTQLLHISWIYLKMFGKNILTSSLPSILRYWSHPRVGYLQKNVTCLGFNRGFASVSDLARLLPPPFCPCICPLEQLDNSEATNWLADFIPLKGPAGEQVLRKLAEQEKFTCSIKHFLAGWSPKMAEAIVGLTYYLATWEDKLWWEVSRTFRI